jgi:hypothetical protein
LDSLKWHHEGGYLPLIHCETQVEGLHVRHSLFQDGTAAKRSEAVCAQLRLANARSEEIIVQVFIVLRSLGPAGAPVHDLKAGTDGQSLWMARRDLPLLGVDRPPSAIGCGIGDPSTPERVVRRSSSPWLARGGRFVIAHCQEKAVVL